MFVVAVVIMVALDWVMQRTMMGKAMRAVAHDQRVASLMGINVTAVMVGAFFLSSALAGLSGFLIAPIASASLYVGLAIALKGFSGAIIGGLSNPRGCVLGGFALGRSGIACESLAGAMAGDRSLPLGDPGSCRSVPTGFSGCVPWRRSDAIPAPHHRRRDLDRRRCLGGSLSETTTTCASLFMMCVYYLCAAGMNVLVGYAGQKSLGQAGLFAAGAYGAALLTTSFDLNPWVALAAAAVIAGLCGVLIAWPSLRVRGPTSPWSRLLSASSSRSSSANGPRSSAGRREFYGIKPLDIGRRSPFANLQWVWFGIALGSDHAPASAEPAVRAFRPGLSLACKRTRSRQNPSALASIATRSWPSSSRP